MSLPANSSSSSQQLPAAASPRLARPPRLRYVFALPLVILVGACVVIQGPREVGRWKLAAALDLRAEGKKEEAYSKLAEAMQWFPDNPMLILQRAEWRLEDGLRDKALADADEVLKLSDDSSSWLAVHSHLMQTAGEHGRAVEDWKKINRESERTGRPERATALNGLAYARALADMEIDEALEDVNQALELEPGNAAILDTRGFLLYLKGGAGSLTVALTDLNKAVTEMDQALSLIKRNGRPSEAAEKRYRLLQSRPRMWLEGSLGSEGDPITRQEMAVRGAAVMHYHRALIFEALGRTAGAEADREAARKLIGKEPDETLF
jgi:tetratricopeptide (TPR) repeat protein